MSGIPNIKVARGDYDTRTASSKDLAFSTEFTIPKIARVARSTTNQSLAHGLGYEPIALFMRELSSSPKQLGHALSSPLLYSTNSVDDTNINFVKVAAGDSAVVAILLADPFGSDDVFRPDSGGRPILKTEDNRFDSRYDSLKVYSSGELTLNVPEWTSSAGTDTNTVSTSVSHDLGYIPFFAPFIPAQTSLSIYYQWYWQWHNRSTWVTSANYLYDDYVQYPASSGTFYICTQKHTSSAATTPGSGASWTDYWVLSTDLVDFPGAPGDIPNRAVDLNSLEDVKIVYGGAFAFVDETVYVYVTSSGLYIKYVRTDSQAFGYSTFPAREVTLSYTIFYNRVDTDFSLLE